MLVPTGLKQARVRVQAQVGTPDRRYHHGKHNSKSLLCNAIASSEADGVDGSCSTGVAMRHSAVVIDC